MSLNFKSKKEISICMIFPITDKFLLSNNYYPSSSYLIDFKNKILYKVYKVIQKENFNKLSDIIKTFNDVIIIFKTYNYYSEIFPNRIRQIIFKEFADINFTSLTQEELEIKLSGQLFKKYKDYDEIYKNFGQELSMRSKNQHPGRMIYILLPLKLYMPDEKKMQEFTLLRSKIRTDEQKFIKTIDNSKLQEYNTYYSSQIEQYKNLEKLASNLFIKPATEINSSFVINDEKQIELLNGLSKLEKEGNLYQIDKEELDGLLNSFFYDSIYISGNRYYNIFNMFNEQLKNLKNGDDFYKLMKILFKQYMITTKVNNSILKSFNSYNLLYFISSMKNLIEKDYNIFKSFDGINSDIDIVIKLSEIKKSYILNFLNKRLSEKILQMENLQKKEEEIHESSVNSIEKSQMEINHYKNLITRIGDERERVFSISGYVLQFLMNQFSSTNLYNTMALNGFDIKQLNPEVNEYNILFDISHDKTAFYIHTTPLLHYLNFYIPLINSIIIDENDIKRMKRISGNLLGGLI